MLTADLTRDIAERVAKWLRYAFPRNTAKEVARTFSVSPHTVTSWLKAEYPPENRHITTMIKRWGFPFLRYIYASLLPSTEDLAQELAELKRRLAQLEPRLLLDQQMAMDPKAYFQLHNQAELAQLARTTAQNNRCSESDPKLNPEVSWRKESPEAA